jgi:hypothetical protein
MARNRSVGGEDDNFFSELRDTFEYSEDHKGLLRKETRTKVGYTMPIGYRMVGFRSKPYYEHRLVWAIFHGEFPDKPLDHINRDKTDNRISNLRKVSASQNMFNTQRGLSKYSGVRGVTWNSRDGKWKPQIRVYNQQINLGSFDCLELAGFVYQLAKERYHRYD